MPPDVAVTFGPQPRARRFSTKAPTGIAGLVKHSDDITDTAFDVLSLEALLLVPRWV